MTKMQDIYNVKHRVKAQLKKIDAELRTIQAGAIAGVQDVSLVQVKQLAKKVYNLGEKVERATLAAVKKGATDATINDLRDMANILEFYSLQLYENAKKLWYTNEIPHFLIFKTVLDPASDLSDQAASVRELDLILEDDDGKTENA
jgi:hypothetical protein